MKVDKINTLAGHKDCIYTLEKGLENHLFFSAGGDGIVAQWNLQNPEIGDVLVQVPNSIYALCCVAERNLLIVGQNFEGLHFIDLTSKLEIKSIKLNSSYIFDLQVWKNQLFVASGDGVVSVIDLDSFQTIKHIKASDKSARCISINPIERHFAVGYSDFSIKIFDLQTLNLVKSIAAHQNSVFSLRYSPDGKFLLSGSRDAHLKIWNVENDYQLYGSIVAHLYAINHIVFSPNRQYFATCSMDKSIKIWDYAQFKLLKVIDKARHAGHGTSVNKLLWSAYQHLIVSGSDDRMVSVWALDIEG